ncbi:MAG: hypothetical protein RI947_331 [Candidatus Parcubacteria bacterium]|jgi:hypothetical protein
MLKVKRFLYTYINSVIPEDQYYHKLSRVPFSFSVKYLFFVVYATYVLFLLLSIAKTNFFSEKRAFINNLILKVRAYPDDLTINIKDGRLMSSYSKPYFMWVPEGDKQHLLAVVDETGSPEKIKMYGSLTLLTSNSFTFYNGARYVSVPYGKQELSINKDTMIKTGKTLDSLYGICKIVIVLFSLFLFPLLFVLVNFVYCVFVSLLTFACWNIFPQHVNKKISFRRILQLSFHALTMPILLISFIVLFDAPLLRLPFTFIVLLMIFTNTAVYEYYIDPPTT